MEDGSGGGGSRSLRQVFAGESNSSTAGITLGGILSIKQTPPYRIHDRTLLDLIRDDQTYGNHESKKKWKIFREKLRLRLAGTVCTTTAPTLASHITLTAAENRTARAEQITPPVDNNTSIVPETEIVPPAPEENLREEVSTSGGGEPRMSLMSLLEVDGSSYVEAEEDDVEDGGDDVAEVENNSGGGGYSKYNNCCVCMVRHKGAAFIPCGHTFCRLCSRELFVKRASCPLCNHFIVEILDIF
uniref:uncharacterized protein LOC122607729 n=1 Tax=Erigeron canadensis TaxID=72917 RepID=UPI001CB994AB|nr:uncharacterized protein LOC122607729 [Erigeron canadensis]